MKPELTIPQQTNYSQAFKLQVVREYERGFRTKDELSRPEIAVDQLILINAGRERYVLS